ncbi:phosphatase PAP2 family protein [Floccifex sp.]|uniref:phosphatase PAP2 family protein n=1 Tax=Floccifex sp. TaxID=2815810 RepID=UPI003EFE37DD
MISFELYILNAIQQIQNPFLDSIMVFFTTLGNNGMIWITLTICFLFFKKTRKIGILLGIGLLLDLILCNGILKPLIHRLRPFTYNDIHLLIPKPRDPSFPSGHTAASFVCVMILFLMNQKGKYLVLLIALFIAFSRLYLYVHFPSDVLAGMFLGLCIGWFVVFFFKKRIDEKR